MCVCVCTHPTTTICSRESQTVRPLNPAGPTLPSTLFPGLSPGSAIRGVETFFPLVCCGGCNNSDTDMIALFFLLLSPSLAQLRLRNRLVPFCICPHC